MNQIIDPEILARVVALFADGGVIKKNPSAIGGTWAWCGVDSEGKRIVERSGVVPMSGGKTISNNTTEQIAITLALEAMPDGWSGIVHSDSQCALGRVFWGWKENKLPLIVSKRSKIAFGRMGKIETVLLQGHPTKKDLLAGQGKKRGLPVSEHNVWCDKACGAAAEKHLADLEAELTKIVNCSTCGALIKPKTVCESCADKAVAEARHLMAAARANYFEKGGSVYETADVARS